MGICRKPTRADRAHTDGVHLHYGLTGLRPVGPALAPAWYISVFILTAAAPDGSQTPAL
ncbi:hypothetical protein BSFA1_86040 (plasmid) [Burkholderia sp. SFA1]|nr:hypothetical protein BSFA1_86040 [Burkholderia sp. SFA1]